MVAVINPASPNPPASGPGKKPYRPPVLETYGKVGELTQSLSGNCKSDGSSTCGAAFSMIQKASDPSVKENVVRIGNHPLGIGLYLFHYKPQFRGLWGHGRQFGVMADEVETVMPEAVSRHSDGYKRVRYDLLGITPTAG